MKDNRFVASFGKIALPIDREDALLARILTEADAERASSEKKQNVNTEYRPNRAANPNDKNSYRIPKKRKALLLAIAAILLLLSACAAYAIYWSSAQRAKEHAAKQANLPDDALQAQAEAYADSLERDSDWTTSLEGTASVNGITIVLERATVFQDADGAEYTIAFRVESESVGLLPSAGKGVRLGGSETYCAPIRDMRDFTLTVDGKTYTATPTADADDASTAAASPVHSVTTAILFRQIAHPVSEDARMHLSGTWHAYDADGNVTGTIGAFSLDFDYHYPTEAIRQKRAAWITEWLSRAQSKNAALVDTLATLPDAAAPIHITQGDYTLVDVAVTQDGILLGEVYETVNGIGSDNYVRLFMDGYQLFGPSLSDVWEPHEEQPKNPYGNFPCTVTRVNTYGWYDDQSQMPKTVLVALLREESTQRWGVSTEIDPSDDDSNYWTIHYEPVEILFRLHTKTGEVQLPANAEERAAWRAENDAAMHDGRNRVRVYPINRKQTVAGMTLDVLSLWVDPRTGCFALRYTLDGAGVLPNAMEVSIDGRKLATSTYPALEYHYDNAYSYMRDYTENRTFVADAVFADAYLFYLPRHIASYDQTFLIDMKWELFRFDAQGQRASVGNFHFSIPVDANAYEFDSDPGDGFTSYRLAR